MGVLGAGVGAGVGVQDQEKEEEEVYRSWWYRSSTRVLPYYFFCAGSAGASGAGEKVQQVVKE